MQRFDIHTGIYNSNLKHVIAAIIDDCTDHGMSYANITYCLDVEIAADNGCCLAVKKLDYAPCVLDKYNTPTQVKRWLAGRIKKMYVHDSDGMVMWNAAYKSLKHGIINPEYNDTDNNAIDYYDNNDDPFSLNDLLFVYMKFRSEWPESLPIPERFDGNPLDPVTTELVIAHRARLQELDQNATNEKNAIQGEYDQKVKDLKAWRDKMLVEISKKFMAIKKTENESFNAIIQPLGLHADSI